MTAYNGSTITYDAIGNPLRYRNNMQFAWSNGRQLVGVYNPTYYGTIYYTYNADGLRASKTVRGIPTNYFWLDGVLLGQKAGNNYTVFLYDENGTPYGFVYNNTYYYYIQNAQGDIIGILDADGNTIVEYTYSAWGEILSITGSAANTIGKQNPLRYRGYYYDTETGFYYLQSRYYDPITCRFINADGAIGQFGNVQGTNMFAYCFNNPVNMSDPTGNWPTWNDIKTGIKNTFNKAKNAVSTAANWVNNKVIQPVKNFISDISIDLKNFDKDNTSEETVLSSNYISAYKGALVIKPSRGDYGFSYGAIVLGKNITDTDDVKHEYGHYVQMREIGVERYIAYVAIPSLAGYWSGIGYEEYYSLPWEYGADLLGGVVRDEGTYPYNDYANQLYILYWDWVAR